MSGRSGDESDPKASPSWAGWVDYTDAATHQVDLTDFDSGGRPSVVSDAVVDLAAARRKASVVPGYDPIHQIASALDDAHPHGDDYDGPDSFATFDWDASPGEATGPMELERLRNPGSMLGGSSAPTHVEVELDESQIITAETASAATAASSTEPRGLPRAATHSTPDYSVTGESSSVLMADEWEADALRRSIWPYVAVGVFFLALVAAICALALTLTLDASDTADPEAVKERHR